MVRRRPDRLHGDDRRAAPRPSRARALPLHHRAGRHPAVAAAAPRQPGQRRVPVLQHGPDLLSARGAGEDRDRHLPRVLPARHAPGARHRRAPLRGDHVPAAEAPRAAAGGLGHGDGAAVRHPGPRLVAHVLRRLPRARLRGDEPDLVRDHRARAVRARRARALRDPAHDRKPRRRLAASVRPRALRPRDRRQLPDRAVDLHPGRRRLLRAGLRPGADPGRRQPAAAAGRAHGLHLRRHHRRARPARGHRRAARLPAHRRARLQDRDARDGLVLQAAGDRADGGARAAGLRHRRRRHEAHPADRRDAAVHLLRRLVDRRELHPARAAAARLRPRAKRGARRERADPQALRARARCCSPRWPG